MRVKKATVEDVAVITEIYNYYVVNSVVTFYEEPISTYDFQKKIESANEPLPWLVYEENNEIYGFAYASEWKSGYAYKGSVESTNILKMNRSGERAKPGSIKLIDE